MTILTFHNKHINPVNVFWGGAQNDKNKLFSILQPGDKYRQESAEGDIWFFKDAVWNKSLGQVKAKADQTVEIKELVRRMAVKESTWEHLNASYYPHQMRADDYALGFDGDDYVSVPHSSSLDLQDNWTLEAWVFRHEKGVEQTVIEKRKQKTDEKDKLTGQGGFALKIGENNRVQGGIFNEEDFIYAEGTTELGGKQWYHVGVSFDAKTNSLRCYVNGEFDGATLYLSHNNPDAMRNVLQFDGTNDYIGIPNINVSETAYTACLWIKVEPDYPDIDLKSQKEIDQHFKATPTPFNCGIFSVDAGVLGKEGHDREIYFQDGKLCASLGSSNPEIITTEERFDDGVWHQVTHVFGGDIGGQRLYVDGKLVAQGSRSSSDFTGQTGINFGFANAAGHPYFKGQLADVSVWSVARSEADIEHRFKQRLSGDEEGLLGLWRLDEGYGWEYDDSTGHGYTFSSEMNVWHLKDRSYSINKPHDNSYSQCTLSMWVKLTGENYVNGLIALRFGQVKFYLELSHAYNHKGLAFNLTDAGYYPSYEPAMYWDWPTCTGRDWSYLSIVLEIGKQPKFYLNGVYHPTAKAKSVPVLTTSGSPGMGWLHTSDMLLISDSYLHSKARGGWGNICISEVSLWDTPRTSDQLKEDMHNSPVMGERGLVGVWKDLGKGKPDDVVTHPYSHPDQAPRWNHHSELRLILPEHFKLQQEHSEARLRIGSDATNEAAFKGIIDSVRIWNTTRSDEQIRSHWNQILQGTEGDLQAYYRFDEGSGNTLTDLTDNNNNGSLGANQAHPSWVESSLLLMDGMALDGQNDYIALPEMEVDYADGITIEAWICLEQNPGLHTIIELSDANKSNLIRLSYNCDNQILVLEIYEDGQGGGITGNTCLDLQQWVHVTCVVTSQGRLILYKNGIPIHQQDNIPAPTSVLRGENYIGKGNGFFKGCIDELRIWNTARTPEQIRGYMRRNIPKTHPKLVAAYSFEEGFGATAFDSSGNSYHGFLGGGNVDDEPQWQKVWASADRGLQFDGQDDYIAFPEMELDFSGGLSLETWAKFSDLNSQASLIDLGNGNPTDNIVLEQSGGDLVFRVYKNNRKKELKATGKLQLNRWTHISATIDRDGNGTLYVDGVAVQTGKLQLPNTVTRSDNYLGKSNVDGSQYFHGSLDDIRLWNVARTEAQVKGNIHRRLFPDSQGLVAYYPTEDGFGQILPDKTTNAYHGSFGGGNASQMPKWIADSPLQFEGFEFDGVKDYVWVKNNAAFNLVTDFSISAWIKPNAFQGLHTIVSKATSIADGQYGLSMDGEKLRFDYHCDGNDFSVVAGQIRDGWNHVAVTVETNTTELYQAQVNSLGEVLTQEEHHEITDQSGNKTTQTVKHVVTQKQVVNQPLISLYVNGLRVMSTTAPKATKPSDADLNIGCLEGVRNDHFFTGAIDSVVIRSKALSQLEIYEDMNQRLSNSTPEVAGYWRLSSSLKRFDYVNDLSGNNHKGTFDHYFYHFYGIDADDQAQRALQLKNGGYVQLDRTTQLTPSWTIEAYFRAPLSSTASLVGLIACDGQNAPIAMQNGLVGCLVDGSFHATADGRLDRVHDGWHHITAIGQGNRTTFYLDDDTEAFGTVPVKCQGGVAKLGGLGNGLSFGVVDEVQIWNHARELKDIQHNMRSALIGTETGLLGYWRFELGRGLFVEDHTPNRNHGTIEGSDNLWLPGSQLGLKAAMLKNRPDVNALEFDGRTQYVAFGAATRSWQSGDALTLQAWVKPHQPAANGAIDGTIVALANNHATCKIAAVNGYWVFDYSDSWSSQHVTVQSQKKIDANTWVHVAGVHSGHAFHLYINNEDQATAAAATATPTVVQFDGTKKAYVCAQHSLLNNRTAFTIEGWVKADSTSDGVVSLFGQNDAIEFGIRQQKLSIWTPHGGSLTVDRAFPVNEWHHVAVVGNGQNLVFYLDGTEIARGGNATSNYGTSSDSFQIGAGVWSGGDTDPFSGQMSEVRVWQIARTQSQIHDKMHERLTGQEGGLVGYWPLGSIQENETPDLTHNNPGTVHQATVQSSGDLPLGHAGSPLETVSVAIQNPHFAIARHPVRNADYFHGQIAEVSLWTTAHSQADVQHYGAHTLSPHSEGLFGYWNFAKLSGNPIPDLTGKDYDGSLQNNPSRIKQAPINLSFPPVCFHFDGSASAIELIRADILHLSDIDFTVEAWIKPEQLVQQQAIVASDDGVFSVGIKNNKTYFKLGNHELIGNDKLVTTDVWYHISWSYSCTTGQTAIILDYKLDAVSNVDYHGFVIPVFVTDILRIGAQGTSYHFQGCISDVRIWDMLRTGDHVCLNKFRRLSGTEKGLLGYWPLDDIDGNYAMDATPLRNYGIQQGECKRVPLGDIKMDLSAIVEMPPAQHQALLAQYAEAAIPVNPQTRALAEGVVPAPGTPTTAGQLSKGGGDLPVTKQATKKEKFFDLDTSGLPSPLKEVADRIIDAINDVIKVPKGELILTSDMLKPFDPFGELFGFKTELLHVKDVGLEIFGDAKLNAEEAKATIGIRLSGNVSIGDLGPIDIEASFYKGKDAKLFDRKKILQGIKGQVKTKTVPVNPNGEDNNNTNDQENNTSNNQNSNNQNGNEGQNQGDNQQQDGKKEEEKGSLFSYLIKFNLPEPTGLGAAFSDVPFISGLNLYKPAKEEEESEGGDDSKKKDESEDDDKRLLALIVTNDEDEDIDLVPYFDGYGAVRFETSDDPVFKVIGTLLGLEEIDLHVAVAMQNYSIEAVDKFDKELVKDTLWFKELGVKLKLATTPVKFDASLSATFVARVEKQELSFTGSVDISTGEETALTGSLSMKGDWRKPFGIEALVISDLAAEIAGSPESPTIVNRVGMTGKLAVGKTSAKLAVMVDVDDPEKFVLVADGENIRFGDIVDSMCGPHVMSEDTCHHLNELISIRTYKVSIIPKACAIGQIKFDEEGITIKIAVTIMDWSADLYVRVDYHDGVTAYATIDPIHWLDGLLVIHESEDRSGHSRTLLTHCPTHVHNIHPEDGKCQVVTQYYCKTHPDQVSDYAAFCPKCDKDANITNAKRMVPHTLCHKPLEAKHGPQFYLRLSPSALPEIYVSGYAEILGISLDAFLSISKQGFEAELQGNIWGLFQTDLYMKVASDLSYVHLRAEMKNDFFAKIRECAVAEIHRIAHQAEQKIEGAKAKVEAADKKVQELTVQINEMRAQVRREREAALRAFRNAQDSVNAASRHVDSILDEIHSTERWFNSLPTWDWPWHESKVRDGAWFGIKIAALYTAYGVAKGVLWAANKVLQGLSWITRVVPIDADPRVWGLIAARETAHLALKAAEGFLDGVDDVVKAAAAVAEQILKLALGELFDVRYAKFEGEFGGPHDLARVEIQAKIVFLKQNLDIDFWFDKNDIAGSISSLAKDLINNHAHV